VSKKCFTGRTGSRHLAIVKKFSMLVRYGLRLFRS
jgi:hypothetical protein